MLRLGAACIPLIAAAAMGLSACGGGSSSARRTAAAATTTTDVNAKIIADYLAFDDLYRRVTAAPDPHSPTIDATLGQHMTGDEETHVHLVLLDLATRGQIVKGPWELHPRIVSIQGDAALIDDCIFDHRHHYDAKTGEMKDDPGDTKHSYEDTLLLRDGTWKVANVENRGNSCTP